MRAAEKIEEAKDLLDGITKDIQGLLSMVQMSIPIGEQIVKKTLSRVNQLKKLFVPKKEETSHGE